MTEKEIRLPNDPPSDLEWLRHNYLEAVVALEKIFRATGLDPNTLNGITWLELFAGGGDSIHSDNPSPALAALVAHYGATVVAIDKENFSPEANQIPNLRCLNGIDLTMATNPNYLPKLFKIKRMPKQFDVVSIQHALQTIGTRYTLGYSPSLISSLKGKNPQKFQNDFIIAMKSLLRPNGKIIVNDQVQP